MDCRLVPSISLNKFVTKNQSSKTFVVELRCFSAKRINATYFVYREAPCQADLTPMRVRGHVLTEINNFEYLAFKISISTWER